MALIPAFILSAGTGTGLHLAGHATSHEIWHNWAVAHIIVSSAFLITGMMHIKMHWNWYKNRFRQKNPDKSKPQKQQKGHITLLLSAVFLSACISGIILLPVEGANSTLGLWHWRLGILLAILSSGHLLKRIKLLRKML